MIFLRIRRANNPVIMSYDDAINGVIYDAHQYRLFAVCSRGAIRARQAVT